MDDEKGKKIARQKTCAASGLLILGYACDCVSVRSQAFRDDYTRARGKQNVNCSCARSYTIQTRKANSKSPNANAETLHEVHPIRFLRPASPPTRSNPYPPPTLLTQAESTSPQAPSTLSVDVVPQAQPPTSSHLAPSRRHIHTIPNTAICVRLDKTCMRIQRTSEPYRHQKPLHVPLRSSHRDMTLQNDSEEVYSTSVPHEQLVYGREKLRSPV